MFCIYLFAFNGFEFRGDAWSKNAKSDVPTSHFAFFGAFHMMGTGRARDKTKISKTKSETSKNAKSDVPRRSLLFWGGIQMIDHLKKLKKARPILHFSGHGLGLRF